MLGSTTQPVIINRPGVAGAVLQTASSLIAELQIEPNKNHLLKNLEGSIFALSVVGWSSVVGHAGDSSDVTLVFEDADW